MGESREWPVAVHDERAGGADDARLIARPEKIVVGYDGSDSAKRALDRAAGLTGTGSLLTVVIVAPSPSDLEEPANGSKVERLTVACASPPSG